MIVDIDQTLDIFPLPEYRPSIIKEIKIKSKKETEKARRHIKKKLNFYKELEKIADLNFNGKLSVKDKIIINKYKNKKHCDAAIKTLETDIHLQNKKQKIKTNLEKIRDYKEPLEHNHKIIISKNTKLQTNLNNVIKTILLSKTIKDSERRVALDFLETVNFKNLPISEMFKTFFFLKNIFSLYCTDKPKAIGSGAFVFPLNIDGRTFIMFIVGRRQNAKKFNKFYAELQTIFDTRDNKHHKRDKDTETRILNNILKLHESFNYLCTAHQMLMRMGQDILNEFENILLCIVALSKYDLTSEEGQADEDKIIYLTEQLRRLGIKSESRQMEVFETIASVFQKNELNDAFIFTANPKFLQDTRADYLKFSEDSKEWTQLVENKTLTNIEHFINYDIFNIDLLTKININLDLPYDMILSDYLEKEKISRKFIKSIIWFVFNEIVHADTHTPIVYANIVRQAVDQAAETDFYKSEKIREKTAFLIQIIFKKLIDTMSRHGIRLKMTNKDPLTFKRENS